MQVVDLLLGFDRSQFDVFLFTFDENLSLKEKLKDCQLHHVNHVRKHKFDFSMVHVISKMIDDNRIDIVHTTLQIALLFGWLGCNLSKRRPPIVHALHKMVGRNKKEALLEKLLYQWPMRACKRVICVCKKQEDFWQGLFSYLKGRTIVIYNGVDTHHFDRERVFAEAINLRSLHRIPEDAIIFACVAAFRTEKNHASLVTAIAKMDSSENAPYLLLAGEGPEKKTIQKIVNDYNISDRVFFLGNLADVRPLMAAADLSIIASTAIETFSIAMLESMSMCCPVVSTDIGGHKEAIFPGISGDIVLTGSVNDLESVLRKYITDKSTLKKMGLNARELVLKEFSVEKMVKNTEKLIREIYKDQER